ncbi:MAG: hypothetical protein V5B35_05810 [Candidatus Accumulibacter necessarius]
MLGFYLVERVLTPDGNGNAAIWLSCSHKVHDIAFVPSTRSRASCTTVSFLLDTWEGAACRRHHVDEQRAHRHRPDPPRGHPRLHHLRWDPSGNRFETFFGGYQPYPDYEP